MSVTAPERPLDERLARAAVAWTLDPVSTDEEVADRLLALAGGNRTAVQRALSRVALRRFGRAAGTLRLTLARGSWSW